MHKDGEPQHFFKSSKEKSIHRHEKAKDKALSKKIGREYKPGMTQGDLLAHKRENFRLKFK